jgi:hypothetical protein
MMCQKEALMCKKTAIALFIFVSTLSLLRVPLSRGEEKAPSPPAESTPAKSQPAGGMVSANGFSCSTLEGKTQCQGKFEDVDKDLVIGAKGSGELTIRVSKRDSLFTYSSSNGCLCDSEEKEISCQNAKGKKEKFKGDKMAEESAAFCAMKK